MPHSESFIESVSKWATDNIKGELKKNRLSAAGNKNQLVSRLQQYFRQEAAAEKANTNQTTNVSAATHNTNNQQSHSNDSGDSSATQNAATSTAGDDLPSNNHQTLQRQSVQWQGGSTESNHQQHITSTPQTRCDNYSTSLQPSIPVPQMTNTYTVSNTPALSGSASFPSQGPGGYRRGGSSQIHNQYPNMIGGQSQNHMSALNPGFSQNTENPCNSGFPNFDTRSYGPGYNSWVVRAHNSTQPTSMHGNSHHSSGVHLSSGHYMTPRPMDPYQLAQGCSLQGNPSSQTERHNPVVVVGDQNHLQVPRQPHEIHRASALSHQQRVTDNSTFPSMYNPTTPLVSNIPNNHTQLPNMASTRLDNHSSSTPCSELEALEVQLKILRTREEIQNMEYRLSLNPDERHQSQQPTMNTTVNMSEFNQTMLQLVKQSVNISRQSVDISSLPPSKPFVFTGKRIDYPRWRSTFDLMVESKSLLPCQKLVYLEQFLGGEALNSVKGFIIQNTTEAYKAARSYLDWMYGDPYDMADEYRERLESWPKIAETDFKGLREYADFLNEVLVATATNIELSTLNDPRILKGFPNVLPNQPIQKWSRLAGSMKYEQNRHAKFEEYCHFVRKEAFLANDNTTSMEAIKSSFRRTEKKGIQHT